MKEVPQETIEYANRAKGELTQELHKHVADWINDFRMDHYPDNDWGEFGKGYLQALDEVKDHLETLL